MSSLGPAKLAPSDDSPLDAPSLHLNPGICQRGHLEVTGNVLELPGGYGTPPDTLAKDPDSDEVAETAAWLDTADYLALDSKASTAAAVSLVAAIIPIMASVDATRRGPKLRLKSSEAIGAIVGGLLKHWSRPTPRPAFRSGKVESFTGGPVAYRQFDAAMAGLIQLELVATQRGFQRPTNWGEVKSWSNGKAARFWPTAELLRLAATHGVAAGTVKADFLAPAPITAPVVRKLVAVSSLAKVVGQRSRQTAKLRRPVEILGDALGGFQRGVEEANAFATQHRVRGCLPPRWYRVFTECAMLGGRWQAAGKEGLYQMMPEAARLAKITINGEPVAEIDVRSSHLSIMHGLLGLPLPDGDLYNIPGVPRPVVKSWVTATLGKGTPVTRWAKKALKDNPAVLEHDAKEVGRLIITRYPFLGQPAQAVARAAGLGRLGHIDTPERLLTHRLMAIEAAALTGAMESLRKGRGLLALPVHDSLIVPQSGVGHVGAALDGAFSYFAKVRMRWTVKTAH